MVFNKPFKMSGLMVAINLFCPECVAEQLKLFTYCRPVCFVPSVLR